MKVSRIGIMCFLLGALMVLSVGEARAQFLYQWLDVGDYQSRYIESGAHHEGATGNRSAEWPAILRNSGHYRSKSFWIGNKDWTSADGRSFPYYVSRMGPRNPGAEFVFPIQNRIIAKWEDTEVIVDGAASFDKIAIVDEVDPSIPADRMLHNIFRTVQGIEVDRKMYAYVNEHHDNYHIIVRTFTNTGNVDDDDEVELEGQTLNEVYFFNIYRWMGNNMASWGASVAQAWGKFSMVDIVGDGHQEYPVDFTAIYLWMGLDTDFNAGWDPIGTPMINTNQWSLTDADTVGRLAGLSFVGRRVLHADNSTTDRSYDPTQQPSSLGWMDSDEILTSDGSPHEDYYELGIRTRENPDRLGEGFSSRMFPHYADRIEPSGEFWNPTNNASTGKQGGHGATVAYGPYDMGPGESVTVVEVETAYGLSYEAGLAIGRAYKQSGFDDDLPIDYDANGNGVIDGDNMDWDYHNQAFQGIESLTKNQWVMTERDSMFKVMEDARRLWEASNNMTTYPTIQPPLPPRSFMVTGLPDKVEMSWETFAGEPDPVSWEIWRTSDYEDRFPYQLVATVPGSARNYDDNTLVRGVDYFYYIVAVSGPQPVDPFGLTGTPEGKPLRSGRYFTQTYAPVNLKRPPGATIDAARVVPNPVNLGSDTSIRFEREDEVAFFDIPGNSTITVYTETGELVKVIEHTDGSGDEKWNLTTDSRQLLVSGIYLVRIVDNDSGQSVTRKMVVLR